MTTASFPTFDRFFEAVHGFGPFPWQEALADRAATDGWPSVIDVPTGLGKTSMIDVAVYRLARELAQGDERVAHTRIALVVDRRLIVDASHGHVARLIESLEHDRDAPVGAVAAALRSAGGDVALQAQRMRGGLDWSSRWVRSPAQPIVLLGTVDQIGSRVLFRGYGTSARMAPIDAGLLGLDTLFLLDEAHLSQAFVETLGSVIDRQKRSDGPLSARPSTVVQMTATPERGTGSLIGADDLDHAMAAQRLTALKNTTLVDVPSATSAPKSVEHAGTVLAKLAIEAVDGMPGSVALVVANTVAAARRAFEIVRGGNVDAALVVGRARGLDRHVQLDGWFERVRAGRGRTGDGRPFVLVATQTIEVGVDIDADVLVTEVAPIDALVQRFGRVDRLGHVGVTESFVVRVPSRLKGDPMPYGPASRTTWEWLQGHVYDVAEASSKGLLEPTEARLDFGTLAMRDMLADADTPTGLWAPWARPPVVIEPTVECWRRTGPVPDPDETVVPYLHGLDRGTAGVTVLWRVDLPPVDNGAIDLWPPVQRHETVEVSLPAAKRWLTGSTEPLDRADVEAAVDEGLERRAPTRSSAGAFLQRGDRWEPLSSVNRLRPNDIVVVPSSFGGHDEWSFAPDSKESVTDVADVSPEPGRAAWLRLDNRVLAPFVGELDDGEARLLAEARDPELLAADRADSLRRLLSSAAARGAGGTYSAAFSAVAASLSAPECRLDFSTVGDETLASGGSTCVTVRGRRSNFASDNGVIESSSMSDVTLDAHLHSVGERARQFGVQMGLEIELVDAVELAGRFHDLGKADARFQAILRGGPLWLADARGPDSTDLLAKSTTAKHASPGGPGARASGWPRGYRHEALSLALVEVADAALFDGVDRQLVEHLVASHHGHARPLFPARLDNDPQHVKVSFGDVTFSVSSDGSHPAWSQPRRFADLCERYGEWGLALLEATVRLADISISEEGR